MPFSSEVAFLFALSNNMSLLNALVFASLGNISAIVLNYWLGYLLYDKAKLNSSNIGRKSMYFGHKYGFFTVLFSWMPIIGDPITIVAGFLRLNFIWFMVLGGLFRVLRYYTISFAL